MRFAKVVLACFVLSTLAQSVGAARTAGQIPTQSGRDRLELSYKQNTSDHSLALATAREALTLFETANDATGIASAYFQVARCYLAMSDLTEATDNFQIALRRWKDLNNAHEQAETLIMLAFIEQRKGEWQNTLSYLSQAQTLSPDDPIHLGQIATSVGDFFNETGVQESALDQFERALGAYRQAGDARGINNTLINIGYTKFLQGNYAGALTDLQTALATSPYELDAAWSNEDLGRVYIALGDYSAALQHLEPALTAYDLSLIHI